MIDVNLNQLKTITRILAGHVPECEVRAFGSRVTGTTKDYSDLDLVVVGERALDLDALPRLKEAFEESDLPFRVDVLDWHAIGPAFQKVIEKKYEVVQKSKTKSLRMEGEWRSSTWGEEISLEYGKALRGYDGANGEYRVFGSNGPVGWTTQPLAPGPGVILGRKGAYRGVQYSPNPFYVIDTAYYVVPKSELDMRWLYYAIKHYKLGEVDDGSPIPSTTRSAVYVLDIEVPPLPEQRVIAHILGTLDDKIELNRRMNETLEAMARALFKSWFMDFDPVRAKADGRNPSLPKPIANLFPDSLTDSEMGEIPKEWEARALYDCANYINGSVFGNDDFSIDGFGLPVIKIGELKDGITGQTKFTEAILEPKYRITSGDILFSWSGSPDTSIDTFVWTGTDGWLNQHIFKIQFKRPEEKSFVYFLLRQFKPMFIEIARNKQTTGLGHVTAQDLKQLKTVFPPSALIRTFHRIAEPLFLKAYSNSCKSHTLAALRDTLLPKLLSGELRTEKAERIVEEANK